MATKHAIEIADHIISQARRDGISLTPLKLQKLLYFAQGWHLALSKNHAPLFFDRIDAWKYGPVVIPVYEEFKRYGATDLMQQTEYGRPAEFEDHRTTAIVDGVWNAYKRFSAGDLVTMTHETDPWKRAITARSTEIYVDEMREYFLHRVGRTVDDA